MERKNIIKSIIASQHNELSDFKLFDRDLKVPVGSGKIIVISGIRRCGKTSLLKLIHRQITVAGSPLRNTLFMNFDDERLALETKELDLILQSYRELYPDIDFAECHFFFDEIQNVGNWEKFIRRLYDTVSKNIFISGSNSKQLGSEITTSLRGRTLQYELYPLSFSEYLRFKGIRPNYYDNKNKALIINAFNKFLKEGGFPETVDRDAELRQRILNDYFQVLLFRDIIERYNVTRISALKFYIKKLIANLGKPFSINKIYHQLKSQGIRIDKDSLYSILEYIEAVYLGLRLYRFDYNVVNREMGDKKIYVIDNGLLNAISFQFSDNYGVLLENMVYIWLKRKFGTNMFYYSKKNECDFVVFDRDKVRLCIQVSYDVSDSETLKRELKGLAEAMDYFHTDNGVILTAEQEDVVVFNDKNIKIIPVYKAFIDDDMN